MPTPATVPALIPLSLLEAIRNLDTPLEDGLDELAEEIVVRRLGLSPTVAAQIQRYRQVAEKDGGVDLDEVVSVLRLVGRRADAPLAFADAGRRAARYATRVHARPAWTFSRAGAGGLSRRIAQRSAAHLARRAFGGELGPAPEGVQVRMAEPLSVQALPDGVGVRLLRRGLRRAAPAGHRVRGRDAPLSLPGAGRRRVPVANGGGGDLRVRRTRTGTEPAFRSLRADRLLTPHPSRR